MRWKCYSRTKHSDELEAALSKASMGKKSTTVIIAIVNKGYIDQGEKPMLDMFLDSFWVGEDTRELMDRLLLVAVDQRSFERCKFLRLHCYKLELILDEGAVDSNGEKLYMSNDFMKMMWRRTLFLGDILKRGYSFIFTVRSYVKLNSQISVNINLISSLLFFLNSCFSKQH